MKPSHLFTIALLLFIATVSNTHAAVVVSNLSEADENFSTTIGPGTAPTWGAVAQAFTTPTTGPGWNLDSLTFTLSEIGTVGSPLNVSLYSDASGTPGTNLGTLNGPSPTGSSRSNYPYTPAGSIVMAPNTSYFAVLTGANDSSNFYEWRNTTSISETGDPGWAIADFDQYQDSTGTWTTDTSRLKIEVNATAVPEPSGFILLGLGSLALLRRRRSA
jgi:hypothetical protein